MNLKNKKVLITGSTGGIGNSLVEKFYNLGAKIIATGTNQEKLNFLKKKFPDIDIENFKLDEHGKIENFINLIDEKMNGIEILVNNAGITLKKVKTFLFIDLDFSLNLSIFALFFFINSSFFLKTKF